MYELRKRHKNSRNGSILSSVYLAVVKAVAFAMISSGYRSQALLYTHSDQRYIRRYGIHDPTQHYLYPCWVRVDLYTAGDEITLQIFGSASAIYISISWLYSAWGKYSSNTSSLVCVPGMHAQSKTMLKCFFAAIRCFSLDIYIQQSPLAEAAKSAIHTNYYGVVNVTNIFYPLLQPNSRY